jgi:transcription-repair coupling factor (superfamily II helicase)
MSNLMRRLTDWGYVKTQNVKSPGEFANRGGILDVFGLGEKHAFRIEYEGNMILHIMELKDVVVKDENEKLKNLVSRQPQIYSKKFSQKDEAAQKLLESLVPGSYVVHIDHGLAQFRGIGQVRESQISSVKDQMLILSYAQNDKLYVPIAVAPEKVLPYVGFGEPRLTRLGGNIWERTKRKVKEDVIKTARELANIYAKREIAKREKYEIDPHIEQELEKTFHYTETADQLKTLEQVKKDFSRQIPMDRIICGDVGFGKTEIALRAALWAVSAGRQAALVTPTTVLAHQHYKTFQRRLRRINYPIKIEKLSRVESKAAQKQILVDILSGKCDIVIGTHRILQKDLRFRNLGLLIIDEEQRFGVKQKEFFKEQRTQLDILSLSATPIPRTLSFALSGLRDISVISTPPHGRLPIKTFVAKLDKSVIKEAAERELKRGGQIYFLHNKISSLEKVVKELKTLLPKAKIDFLHAKLPENEIIAKMEKFAEDKIDMLVTTTIMENGLDLENANTLIVDNASRLGLAQAHQIRGRIGRGDRQAYAYFLYPGRKLPPKSEQRITALKEAQYLGAGYQIALRDLEIRGAGSFLGRAQSGNIAKVGFNLYCQMLNEAIDELRSLQIQNAK